jgi:peptide-methionine (S)-S-oxide reductase
MKYILITILLTLGFPSKAQKNIDDMEAKWEVATFGGGCFWCTEAVFEEVKGVRNVISGYAGGKIINPSYREVSRGVTGHAEVIQLEYNPRVISYSDILTIFFKTHDPTSLNRQGADIGTQYRSVIFYRNEDQKNQALAIINKLENEGKYDDPIVTAVEPFINFFIAEDYHQDFFKNNPNHSYCSFVIQPKVNKLYKDFSEKLK